MTVCAKKKSLSAAFVQGVESSPLTAPSIDGHFSMEANRNGAFHFETFLEECNIIIKDGTYGYINELSGVTCKGKDIPDPLNWIALPIPRG